MATSRLDISNAAISIFLHEVSTFYDHARGFAAFGPTEEQAHEVLHYFFHRCCYCAEMIDARSVAWAHLVPVDKTALGLHAWGNVVPCCRGCSVARQQKTWREFLKQVSASEDFSERAALIESFASTKRYDLSLNLHGHADGLYEDIGAIAMTLIQLRYKQAEQKIRATLSAKKAPKRDLESVRSSDEGQKFGN